MSEPKYEDVICGIDNAITSGLIPDDIAHLLKDSEKVFISNPKLFNSYELKGDKKVAELRLKLGIWMANNKLTAKGFYKLCSFIPPDHNAGWEVEWGGQANYFDNDSCADEPILISPAHHSEGSDKSYLGNRYHPDGRVAGGGTMRIAMPHPYPSYNQSGHNQNATGDNKPDSLEKMFNVVFFPVVAGVKLVDGIMSIFKSSKK